MSTVDDFHEEDEVGKVYDGRLVRRLLGYLSPYRWRAFFAVGLILMVAALNLVGPLITASVLDLFVAPDNRRPAEISLWLASALENLGVALDPVSGVVFLAWLYALAVTLAFFVQYAQIYIMEMMGQRIMHDLRRDVFGHLQKLGVAYFDHHPIGRLVTRATTDVAALNELFTAGLVQVFGDLFLLAGILSTLFLLDVRLAVVTLSILPLLLLLTIWFKAGARRAFRWVRKAIARINAHLQEHITGMSVVQIFRREQQAFAEFERINEDHRAANVATIFYYAVYYPGVELITALGLALIVWYGGGRILDGVLSFGALVAFLQYAQRFYRPLANLSEKYNVLQSAMASSERIFELLDTPVDITSPPEPHRGPVRGALELDSVVFAYRTGETVLHDISFRIEPGETVAVVGHTGAGKSTLASLLMRFYDVSNGQVKVDGIDVRRWDLSVLRRGIGMVLQDVFLFTGDVASNIRLGESSIDEARLRWAADEVGALDFIERLPGAFGAKVRERGAGLSVGQKQLVAFARALAFDPRVLILDEATASIDTETEQRIQKALERLLVGRTSLVIAHRLSTIQKADRILVLHKGRLREEGTHQELIARRGIYHKLVELQFREEPSALAS